MSSQAWRRRRKGFKLRNHHSAQATADDVITQTEDVGDVTDTGYQDQKQSGEENWFHI